MSDPNANLRFIISRAAEIVRHEEQTIKRFLDLDLAFMATLGFLFTYILSANLNEYGRILLSIPIIIFFIYAIIAIFTNLIASKTKNIEKSFAHFRGWNKEELLKDLENKKFTEDYKTQITSLHSYQKNYNRYAILIRKVTLWGLFSFSLNFLVNLIIVLVFSTLIIYWVLWINILLSMIAPTNYSINKLVGYCQEKCELCIILMLMRIN